MVVYMTRYELTNIPGLLSLCLVIYCPRWVCPRWVCTYTDDASVANEVAKWVGQHVQPK